MTNLLIETIITFVTSILAPCVILYRLKNWEFISSSPKEKMTYEYAILIHIGTLSISNLLVSLCLFTTDSSLVFMPLFVALIFGSFAIAQYVHIQHLKHAELMEMLEHIE